MHLRSDYRKNKNKLYEAYPQLGSLKYYEENKCSVAINRYLTYIYDTGFQNMWQSSVKMLTDLGMKDPCQQQEYIVYPVIENGEGFQDAQVTGMGVYSMAKMNVTDLRGIARTGFCFP